MEVQGYCHHEATAERGAGGREAARACAQALREVYGGALVAQQRRQGGAPCCGECVGSGEDG